LCDESASNGFWWQSYIFLFISFGPRVSSPVLGFNRSVSNSFKFAFGHKRKSLWAQLCMSHTVLYFVKWPQASHLRKSFVMKLVEICARWVEDRNHVVDWSVM
jgi:hypothetical protein